MNTRMILMIIVAYTIVGLGHASPAENGTVEEGKAKSAFAKGHHKKASILYQRVLQNQPNRIDIRLKIAKNQVILNQLDEAEQQANEVLKQDGQQVEALLLMGRINGIRSNWMAARKYYEQAVMVDSTNETAYLGLGQSLNRLGDQDGADQAFAQYKELKEPTAQ